MIKPASCDGCVLESYRNKEGKLIYLGKSYVPPDGNGTSGVMLIGEAPGHYEVVEQKPFVVFAQAGSKLNQALKIKGFTRNQFRLGNVVQCQPPGNKLAGAWYEQQAVEHCRKNLDRLIRNFSTDKKKTLVALGNTALKALIGVSGIAKERMSVSALRGFVLESEYGPVIPSYHPSYIKRGNGKYTPVLATDIAKAVRVAQGLCKSYSWHPEYRKPDYNTTPSIEEGISYFRMVKDNPKLPLAYDIETEATLGIDEDEREVQRDFITQIQFSLKKDEAIAFEWKEPYIKIARAILALPNPKLSFNGWFFDAPMLATQGIEVKGKEHDLMQMFKQLHPDYDRNLQAVASLYDFPFPWKHLYGDRLAWYGCADVDSLHWILKPLMRQMKETQVWEGYKEMVLGIHPIMIRTSKRGFPVSKVEKEKITRKIQKTRDRIETEIQEMVPEELKKITPRRKIEEKEVESNEEIIAF